MGLLKKLFGASFKGATPEELSTEPCTNNPTELGHVQFLNDLDAAYKLSKESGKPIFLLFQEIPGCSTCTNFGTSVLKPPAMIRAISNAFIPVAINNRCRSNHDSNACRKFGEPKLNNPVVRFIDARGKDLIPRQGGVYSASALVPRMKQALKKADRRDLLAFLP